MFDFRTGVFGLILATCLCKEPLFIDEMKKNFLNFEERLLNITMNIASTHTFEDRKLFLIKNFDEFDRMLQKVSPYLLFDLEPLGEIKDFVQLYADFQTISDFYNTFRDFLNRHKNKKLISLEDLTYHVKRSTIGVEDKYNNICRIIYNKNSNFNHELEKLIHKNYECKDSNRSSQQLLYNLYNFIELNSLKAYILIQFIHFNDEDLIATNGNRLKLYRLLYKTFVNDDIKILTKSVSRHVWRCDPKLFSKGINYDKFTRLLEGHIANEVDMNVKNTCTETCTDYTDIKSNSCYQNDSDFCQKTERCKGRLFQCFYVEADATICASDSPVRRYDFVKYKSGLTYGRTNFCHKYREANSWTRWFVKCSYCMCLCDQQGGYSDRYINLRPVKANVAKNSVITGVRFVKHNRIVFLQIQEGVLLSYGHIDSSTVHWVAVDEYKITDPNVRGGEDFFIMTYGERAMAMDEVEVKKTNHAVTGVQFRNIGHIIFLEIRVTPFDWLTGTLKPKNSFSINYSNLTNRKKINIENPEIPIRTDKLSNHHKTSGKNYVEFTHSDFIKDAAQTTIPFIDIQDVKNNPPVPLAGIGIYYKGAPGYGGFIAPRILTYDYSKHY